MDYRKAFAVEPESRVRLDRIDPSSTGGLADEAAAADAFAHDQDRIARAQYALYAEGRRSLLVVLQAPDGGGKDGTIRHVFRAMNPQGASVYPFKVPTPDEAAHDFLWRAHRVTPAHGQVAIFNRSYYEDVLVVRVHGLVPDDVWSKRYARILDFEKNLRAAGTTILKFFLHIGADEQLRRFEKRLDAPDHRWKISESDYAERAFWDDYRRAYEAMLERCSTRRSPWYVIPANHKWFRNAAVANIVARTLDDMDITVPQPHVDIDEIRRKYHLAAAEPHA